MKPTEASKPKKFDKGVRWNFKIAVHGYGKNVRQALIDASRRLELQIEQEFSHDDFIAIQNHEVVSIDENDVDGDD